MFWLINPLRHQVVDLQWLYLVVKNYVIQLIEVISPEGLKLQTCNSPQIYSYSRSIRLPTPHYTAEFPDSFYKHLCM